MWPTIIVATIIGLIFLAIIVNEIKKKKSGKNSCSCGCSCGGCQLSHLCNKKEN